MKNHKTRRAFRFTLSQFLFLILGVAIGFAPMQYWRSRQPAPTFSIDIRVADVPTDLLSDLGLPNSSSGQHRVISDSESLLSQLNALEESDPSNYWSGSIHLTEGKSTRMETGMSYNYPVVADDGTPGIAKRYDGHEFDLQCDGLIRGDLSMTFEIADTIPDYKNAIKVGDTRVPPQFERRIASQVVIPKDKYVAIAGGKHTDREGVEREMVILFSGSRIEAPAP